MKSKSFLLASAVIFIASTFQAAALPVDETPIIISQDNTFNFAIAAVDNCAETLNGATFFEDCAIGAGEYPDSYPTTDPGFEVIAVSDLSWTGSNAATGNPCTTTESVVNGVTTYLIWGDGNPSTVSKVITYDENGGLQYFLTWAVDDAIKWSVNGEVVLEVNNYTGQWEILNLTQFLSPGENTISALLTNLHPPCWGMVCMIYAAPFDSEIVDCAGVVNGSSQFDECGVCRTPGDPAINTTCNDCAGIPNGGAIIDDCGTCAGGSTGVEPCAGPDFEVIAVSDLSWTGSNAATGNPCTTTESVVNGVTTYLIWGDGNPSTVSKVITYDENDGLQYFLTWVVDDAVIWSVNGEVVIEDNFNGQWKILNLTEFLSQGENTISALLTDIYPPCWGMVCMIYAAPFDSEVVDCAGVVNGSSQFDECGVCRTPGDPAINTTCNDCAGIPNGGAFIDDCAECVGGNTGLVPCTLCNTNGGTLSAPATRSFCVGTGSPNGIPVSVTGAWGTNQAYVLINNTSGAIVATISSNSNFNLDIYPPGEYSIRYIRYENDVTNIGSITNINQINTLVGCYGLAGNAINLFLRNEPQGGVLSAITPTSVCTNAGAASVVQVTVAGNSGQFSRFGITSTALGQEIIASNTSGVFNLNGLAPGNYNIGHISYEQGVNLAGISFPNELQGCYDLSNSISVTILSCAPSSLGTQPNPTTGISTVSFNVPETGQVTLELFDLSGRNVATLFNQEAQAGQEYRLNFDGAYLPNGIFIFRLTTGKEVIIEKMMIAK